MYEILRVPHQIDQFMKAFNMMVAYSQPPIYKYDFKEFYRLVKEVYMISDGCSYLGAGAILHKEYKNLELPYIFRSYGDNVYELLVVDFDKEDSYKKYYDLIKTLLRDCNDRLVFCESIPNTNRDLINALKNNRFRSNKGNDRKDYTQTLFYTPIYSKLIENELIRINPRDDLHTIDKMNTFECEDHKIKEAQDKYTQELIKKNLSEISYEVNDTCCCQRGQTEEQFLDEGGCCCRHH